MSSSLQVPGLMSGLGTSDIIQRILEAERLPLTTYQKKKEAQQKKVDALRDINTRLSALLSKIQTLNLRSTIDAKSVTTDTPASSPTLVTASASADAASGNFKVKVVGLATATGLTSSSAGTPVAIGEAVQSNQPLASAGFVLTPTTGTFTINGAEITIDSSTVLSDATDLAGANTIFAKVRDATAAVGKRVDVSWELDANGRQNKLELTANDGVTAIQLGSGSDTSNFLTAAGLAALPSAITMTGARNLGGVKTSALLNSSEANLDIALNATGSFEINGVAITYDTSRDTLTSIISRINASAAGVNASYDSATDRITLTSRATGSSLIGLEDVTGNFLAAMRLSVAAESVGTNASYYLNDEVGLRYSTSNTVTDAVSGVTINLTKADPTTYVSVAVSQNTSSAVSAVQDFVSQYNSAMSLIREKLAYNATLKQGGILMGDSTLQGVERTLSALIAGAGDGLSSVARSLAEVGITTGAIGSSVGKTATLVLDTSTLIAKLQSNPAAVANVFGGLSATVELAAGGTGSISTVSGTPTKHVSGSYAVVSDASGNLTVTFTPTSGSTVVTTGTISAGGTNTTLIPGLTLTAKDTLAAGTDTIEVDFTSIGVGVKFSDYLLGVTSSTGLFAERQESASGQVEATNKSIERLQNRLAEKEKALYARFRGLEVALARLQGQSAALTSQLSKLD